MPRFSFVVNSVNIMQMFLARRNDEHHRTKQSGPVADRDADSPESAPLVRANVGAPRGWAHRRCGR